MIKRYKKVVLNVIIACAVLASGVAFKTLLHKPTSTADVKLSYYADSIDSLANDSQAILVGTATNKSQEITFEGVEFVTTEIKVDDVVKADNEIGKTITLLQTKVEEDPIIEKGTQTLLFLDKYEGPIVEIAYVTKGLYQGQYKIKDKEIKINELIRKENSKLEADIKSKSDLIGSLKEKFRKDK